MRLSYLLVGPLLALVNSLGDQELKGIIEGANAGAVFADEKQGKLVQQIDEK